MHFLQRKWVAVKKHLKESKNKVGTLLEKQSDPQRKAKYKQLSDELYAWHEKESDELIVKNLTIV